MSEDPAAPQTPVLVDLEDAVNILSPTVDCLSPTQLRPSTSPTSSTPSSSPDDKKLKESDLLNSEESLVNSHFVQEDDGNADLYAKVDKVALPEPLVVGLDLDVGSDTPIIQKDNGSDVLNAPDSDSDSDKIKASPVQVDSGRNEANPPTNQVASGKGKQEVIPVIDLEEDLIVEFINTDSLYPDKESPVKSSPSMKRIILFSPVKGEGNLLSLKPHYMTTVVHPIQVW